MRILCPISLWSLPTFLLRYYQHLFLSLFSSFNKKNSYGLLLRPDFIDDACAAAASASSSSAAVYDDDQMCLPTHPSANLRHDVIFANEKGDEWGEPKKHVPPELLTISDSFNYNSRGELSNYIITSQRHITTGGVVRSVLSLESSSIEVGSTTSGCLLQGRTLKLRFIPCQILMSRRYQRVKRLRVSTPSSSSLLFCGVIIHYEAMYTDMGLIRMPEQLSGCCSSEVGGGGGGGGTDIIFRPHGN